MKASSGWSIWHIGISKRAIFPRTVHNVTKIHYNYKLSAEIFETIKEKNR